MQHPLKCIIDSFSPPAPHNSSHNSSISRHPWSQIEPYIHELLGEHINSIKLLKFLTLTQNCYLLTESWFDLFFNILYTTQCDVLAANIYNRNYFLHLLFFCNYQQHQQQPETSDNNNIYFPTTQLSIHQFYQDVVIDKYFHSFEFHNWLLSSVTTNMNTQNHLIFSINSITSNGMSPIGRLSPQQNQHGDPLGHNTSHNIIQHSHYDLSSFQPASPQNNIYLTGDSQYDINLLYYTLYEFYYGINLHYDALSVLLLIHKNLQTCYNNLLIDGIILGTTKYHGYTEYSHGSVDSLEYIENIEQFYRDLSIFERQNVKMSIILRAMQTQQQPNGFLSPHEVHEHLTHNQRFLLSLPLIDDLESMPFTLYNNSNTNNNNNNNSANNERINPNGCTGFNNTPSSSSSNHTSNKESTIVNSKITKLKYIIVFINLILVKILDLRLIFETYHCLTHENTEYLNNACVLSNSTKAQRVAHINGINKNNNHNNSNTNTNNVIDSGCTSNESISNEDYTFDCIHLAERGALDPILPKLTCDINTILNNSMVNNNNQQQQHQSPVQPQFVSTLLLHNESHPFINHNMQFIPLLQNHIDQQLLELTHHNDNPTITTNNNNNIIESHTSTTPSSSSSMTDKLSNTTSFISPTHSPTELDIAISTLLNKPLIIATTTQTVKDILHVIQYGYFYIYYSYTHLTPISSSVSTSNNSTSSMTSSTTLNPLHLSPRYQHQHQQHQISTNNQKQINNSTIPTIYYNIQFKAISTQHNITILPSEERNHILITQKNLVTQFFSLSTLDYCLSLLSTNNTITGVNLDHLVYNIIHNIVGKINQVQYWFDYRNPARQYTNHINNNDKNNMNNKNNKDKTTNNNNNSAITNSSSPQKNKNINNIPQQTNNTNIPQQQQPKEQQKQQQSLSNPPLDISTEAQEFVRQHNIPFYTFNPEIKQHLRYIFPLFDILHDDHFSQQYQDDPQVLQKYKDIDEWRQTFYGAKDNSNLMQLDTLSQTTASLTTGFQYQKLCGGVGGYYPGVYNSDGLVHGGKLRDDINFLESNSNNNNNNTTLLNKQTTNIFANPTEVKTLREMTDKDDTGVLGNNNSTIMIDTEYEQIDEVNTNTTQPLPATTQVNISTSDKIAINNNHVTPDNITPPTDNTVVSASQILHLAAQQPQQEQQQTQQNNTTLSFNNNIYHNRPVTQKYTIKIPIPRDIMLTNALYLTIASITAHKLETTMTTSNAYRIKHNSPYNTLLQRQMDDVIKRDNLAMQELPKICLWTGKIKKNKKQQKQQQEQEQQDDNNNKASLTNKCKPPNLPKPDFTPLEALCYAPRVDTEVLCNFYNLNPFISNYNLSDIFSSSLLNQGQHLFYQQQKYQHVSDILGNTPFVFDPQYVQVLPIFKLFQQTPYDHFYTTIYNTSNDEYDLITKPYHINNIIVQQENVNLHNNNNNKSAHQHYLLSSQQQKLILTTKLLNISLKTYTNTPIVLNKKEYYSRRYTQDEKQLITSSKSSFSSTYYPLYNKTAQFWRRNKPALQAPHYPGVAPRTTHFPSQTLSLTALTLHDICHLLIITLCTGQLFSQQYQQILYITHYVQIPYLKNIIHNNPYILSLQNILAAGNNTNNNNNNNNTMSDSTIPTNHQKKVNTLSLRIGAGDPQQHGGDALLQTFLYNDQSEIEHDHYLFDSYNKQVDFLKSTKQGQQQQQKQEHNQNYPIHITPLLLFPIFLNDLANVLYYYKYFIDGFTFTPHTLDGMQHVMYVASQQKPYYRTNINHNSNISQPYHYNNTFGLYYSITCKIWVYELLLLNCGDILGLHGGSVSNNIHKNLINNKKQPFITTTTSPHHHHHHHHHHHNSNNKDQSQINTPISLFLPQNPTQLDSPLLNITTNIAKLCKNNIQYQKVPYFLKKSTVYTFLYNYLGNIKEYPYLYQYLMLYGNIHKLTSVGKQQQTTSSLPQHTKQGNSIPAFLAKVIPMYLLHIYGITSPLLHTIRLNKFTNNLQGNNNSNNNNTTNNSNINNASTNLLSQTPYPNNQTATINNNKTNYNIIPSTSVEYVIFSDNCNNKFINFYDILRSLFLALIMNNINRLIKLRFSHLFNMVTLYYYHHFDSAYIKNNDSVRKSNPIQKQKKSEEEYHIFSFFLTFRIFLYLRERGYISCVLEPGITEQEQQHQQQTTNISHSSSTKQNCWIGLNGNTSLFDNYIIINTNQQHAISTSTETNNTTTTTTKDNQNQQQLQQTSCNPNYYQEQDQYNISIYQLAYGLISKYTLLSTQSKYYNKKFDFATIMSHYITEFANTIITHDHPYGTHGGYTAMNIQQADIKGYTSINPTIITSNISDVQQQQQQQLSTTSTNTTTNTTTNSNNTLDPNNTSPTSNNTNTDIMKNEIHKILNKNDYLSTNTPTEQSASLVIIPNTSLQQSQELIINQYANPISNSNLLFNNNIEQGNNNNTNNNNTNNQISDGINEDTLMMDDLIFPPHCHQQQQSQQQFQSQHQHPQQPINNVNSMTDESMSPPDPQALAHSIISKHISQLPTTMDGPTEGTSDYINMSNNNNNNNNNLINNNLSPPPHTLTTSQQQQQQQQYQQQLSSPHRRHYIQNHGLLSNNPELMMSPTATTSAAQNTARIKFINDWKVKLIGQYKLKYPRSIHVPSRVTLFDDIVLLSNSNQSDNDHANKSNNNNNNNNNKHNQNIAVHKRNILKTLLLDFYTSSDKYTKEMIELRVNKYNEMLKTQQDDQDNDDTHHSNNKETMKFSFFNSNNFSFFGLGNKSQHKDTAHTNHNNNDNHHQHQEEKENEKEQNNIKNKSSILIDVLLSTLSSTSSSFSSLIQKSKDIFNVLINAHIKQIATQFILPNHIVDLSNSSQSNNNNNNVVSNENNDLGMMGDDADDLYKQKMSDSSNKNINNTNNINTSTPLVNNLISCIDHSNLSITLSPYHQIEKNKEEYYKLHHTNNMSEINKLSLKSAEPTALVFAKESARQQPLKSSSSQSQLINKDKLVLLLRSNSNNNFKITNISSQNTLWMMILNTISSLHQYVNTRWNVTTKNRSDNNNTISKQYLNNQSLVMSNEDDDSDIDVDTYAVVGDYDDDGNLFLSRKQYHDYIVNIILPALQIICNVFQTKEIEEYHQQLILQYQNTFVILYNNILIKCNNITITNIQHNDNMKDRVGYDDEIVKSNTIAIKCQQQLQMKYKQLIQYNLVNEKQQEQQLLDILPNQQNKFDKQSSSSSSNTTIQITDIIYIIIHCVYNYQVLIHYYDVGSNTTLNEVDNNYNNYENYNILLKYLIKALETVHCPNQRL